MFVDPLVLLPRLVPRIQSGGVYVFTHPEPLYPGIGPQVVYANGYRGRKVAVTRWLYPPDRWERMLLRAGFSRVDVEVLPGPNPDDVGTVLGRAYVD
jgi:hypothetical protein